MLYIYTDPICGGDIGITIEDTSINADEYYYNCNVSITYSAKDFEDKIQSVIDYVHYLKYGEEE